MSRNNKLYTMEEAAAIVTRDVESGLQMALNEIAYIARQGEKDIHHLQYLNQKYNLGLGNNRDLADRIAEMSLRMIKNSLPRESS